MVHEYDLQQKYEAIFPLLNERQHRVIAAADALALGRGGVWLSDIIGEIFYARL
jgi:hypothetical protein